MWTLKTMILTMILTATTSCAVFDKEALLKFEEAHQGLSAVCLKANVGVLPDEGIFTHAHATQGTQGTAAVGTDCSILLDAGEAQE